MKQFRASPKLWPYLLFALIFLAAAQARAACTNPAGVEPQFVYNTDYHTYQFCNGTTWMAFGGGSASYTGGTPTISSCGGAGAAVTGTDVSFKFTVASAGITTTGANKCVINFGMTWATAPNSCVMYPGNISAGNDAMNWYISGISTTQFSLGLLSGSGGAQGSDVYYVQCQ
jgi:hypothetical protein